MTTIKSIIKVTDSLHVGVVYCSVALEAAVTKSQIIKASLQCWSGSLQRNLKYPSCLLFLTIQNSICRSSGPFVKTSQLTDVNQQTLGCDGSLQRQDKAAPFWSTSSEKKLDFTTSQAGFSRDGSTSRFLTGERR